MKHLTLDRLEAAFVMAGIAMIGFMIAVAL
jgi:hypothetical protein